MTATLARDRRKPMKRFLALIIAVLAAAALWTGFWFFVAGQISAEAEYLAQADGITAPRLDCEDFAVSGYPFHFSPICNGAQIVSGDLTLTIPQLSATALFYRPSHLQIFAAAPARLSDAFTGSAHEVSWSNLRASLRLDGSRIARFSLVGDGLIHADALFGSIVLESADSLELHLVDATPADAPATGGQTLDLFTRIKGVTAEGFEIAEGDATIDARLSGVPPLDLLAHPELLRLWQMADGALTLRQLDATAQGVEITASGEAALDDTGRLNAALELSSRGLVERFDGLVDDPVAALFIGQPDASGNYSQSLSVRGGTVFVGILPVMALQPVF
jgi:hypothetical protein